VGAVVLVAWQSLARGAEICVVANSALVSDALDVVLVGLAATQRSIAVDAEVANSDTTRLRNWLVEGREAMAWVDVVNVLVAVVAVVPIRAIQALVANAEDLLVTSVADGAMTGIAAGSEQHLSREREDGVFRGWLEAVGGMMSVLLSNVALDAEIKVRTRSASHELALWKDYHAAVASAGGDLRLSKRLGVVVEGAWDLFLDLWLDLECRLRLVLAGRDTLSGAADDLAILDESLDEPVALTWAELATGDAALAQVVVTTIADVAVEMGIRHCHIALVAIDRPGVAVSGDSRSWLAATEDEVSLHALLCQALKEVLPVRGERTWDWSL
jgi:hypothetical protein